ncbi:hypothetical protein LSAT2_012383 [Lamellibrachia satsuma]|nr:hypothetical protein LSAT2_012383 [Lamellibrachia satsuma]
MGNSRSSRELALRAMPLKVRELHYAVMANNSEVVRTLVAEGVNVNFPWYNPTNPSMKDGTTPLIVAVSLNHTDIVEELLRAGAYINKCDRNGCTPIYKAAFHGRSMLIELLSRTGADVNLADFIGKTPLYICVNNAIVHSCKIAIQKLIYGGAIIDKADRAGQAPIHIAAQWKLTDVLQMLIAAQGNVNIADNKGRTPLYICVRSLSTKLYMEDLRHQLPCIFILYRTGADMLNFTEWLHYKGSGIPDAMMVGAVEFRNWYVMQITRPQTLKNLCRKVIQKTCRTANLRQISGTLPVPRSLQVYLSRKLMFYREEKLPS